MLTTTTTTEAPHVPVPKTKEFLKPHSHNNKLPPPGNDRPPFGVDAAVVLNVSAHPAHLYALEPPTMLPLSARVMGGTAHRAHDKGGGCGSIVCMQVNEKPNKLSGGHGAYAMEEGSRTEGKAACRSKGPPPMFIILISLLEIGVFVYDYLTVTPQSELNSTRIPRHSTLIYRPDRRLEIWRFVSYMVLHANWLHLGFNVIVQLLYGLPLEWAHGSVRIAVIYLAGVFAGSLGTSVIDSAVYLVGASGGVYALLAAQLANVLLNYAQMRYGIAQLVSVLIFVACDVGYVLYSEHFGDASKVMLPAVSYVAHVSGALAGFTMGLLVLRNFHDVADAKKQTNLVWWLALSVYLAFMIFAIVFNLVNTVTAQMLEQEGEVIKQHLLHDLGIS